MTLIAHHSDMPRPCRRQVLAAAALALLAASGAGFAADPREISWADLIPKDWDPLKSLGADLQQAGAGWQDNDPRAKKLLDRMRKAWDDAPTVPAMAGRTVKLPGFLVPLEETRGEVREFLLVPYFGACIHMPPPPANQIIHVHATAPAKGLRTMDAVWVVGTLSIAVSNSEMGKSGYAMKAQQVSRHVAPKR